jgi:predicted nucleic acid-binding Zn ribbon protein
MRLPGQVSRFAARSGAISKNIGRMLLVSAGSGHNATDKRAKVVMGNDATNGSLNRNAN